MTKCVRMDLNNVTFNVLDQKSSNLCVPISVATLIRFAIKEDLDFVDRKNDYTLEKIVTCLTMRVYPRSLVGLNLNPNEKEVDFQMNDAETLLKRICKLTYLKETGWEMLRMQGYPRPAESTCEYKQGNHFSFLFKFR